MSRRFLWLLPLVLGLALWLFTEVTPGGESSTLSKGGDGWFGLRRILELDERPTRLVKRPWSQLKGEPITPDPFVDDAPERFAGLDPESEILVTAFPWQRGMGDDEMRGLHNWLRRGGTVVLAYSDGLSGPWESEVLEGLGMQGGDRLRPSPPWSPTAWWAHRRTRWTLSPEPAAGPLPTLEMGAVERAPQPPDGARILYRRPPSAEGDEVGEEDDRTAPPMVFTFEHLAGRVLVLPARLWSNGELLKAGNLQSAVWLAREVGAEDGYRWCFDEFHHGFVAADLAAAEVDRLPWDLFFLHLGLIYLLGLWALARPFGPVRQEPAAHSGSAATFLENLGSFHHRLGHHRDAARRMRARILDLSPRLDEDTPDLPSAAEADAVSGGAELVAFAQRLAAWQGPAKTKNSNDSREHKGALNV